MRHLLFAALLLGFALSAFAEESPTLERGIALYDAGRYDEAVAVFRSMLAANPADESAAYELGLTYAAKGDVAACRAVAEPWSRKKGRFQPAFYVILGNCLDAGGDAKGAIAAYRKGLRLAPEDPQLLYNYSVALVGQGKLDEGRKLLKKEVGLAPSHGSAHLLLAKVFEAQNFRVPAAMQYLRFLAIEPSGPRAKEAATRLIAILNLGIEIKDEKHINITVDPAPRMEEGDFRGAEMMLALAGGAATMPEKKALSEFEKARQQVASTLAMLTEAPPEGRNYTANQLVPFFARIVEQEMLETVAGLALSSLELPGTGAWKEANAAAIQAYAGWMNAQQKR
jgi:tetratricopeptide (TPR) repeat protein